MPGVALHLIAPDKTSNRLLLLMLGSLSPAADQCFSLVPCQRLTPLHIRAGYNQFTRSQICSISCIKRGYFIPCASLRAWIGLICILLNLDQANT